jgi:hypothetical protein
VKGGKRKQRARLRNATTKKQKLGCSEGHSGASGALEVLPLAVPLVHQQSVEQSVLLLELLFLDGWELVIIPSARTP